MSIEGEPGARRGPLRVVIRWRPDAFTVLFGLALLANALVVARARYWPMGDLGGHIELMDIMMRYESPHTTFREHYILPHHLGANTLLLYFARWTRCFTDAFGATRMALVAYVVAIPLSVLTLARAFGRSRWLAFFAVPMAFSSIYTMGFVNYLVGVPILVFVVAAARTFAERGGRGRGALLAFLLVLLFWAHIITFSIGFCIALFVVVFSVPRPRDLRRLVAFMPVLLPFSEWAAENLSPSDEPSLVAADGALGMVWNTPEYLFGNMHGVGMRTLKTFEDEYATLTLGLLWLFALGLSSRGPSARLGEATGGALAALRGAVREHTLEIVAVLTFLGYFAIPSHMNEMNTISERIVSLAMLFFAPWPRARFAGAQKILLVPLVALAFGYAAVMDRAHQRFEARYYARLPAAIEALPERSRMAYLFVERDNEDFYFGSLWHMPRAIHVVANGGVTNDNYAIRSYTPVQMREGRGLVRLPVHGFEESSELGYYDAVLLRSRTPPARALESARVKLVLHDGEWWLFRVSPEVIREFRARR